MRDVSQPVGIVVGVGNSGLSSDGHGGSAACVIVGVGDRALRRGLGSKPVQIVIAASNLPSNLVLTDFPHSTGDGGQELNEKENGDDVVQCQAMTPD